jgi:hypothetical protein
MWRGIMTIYACTNEHFIFPLLLPYQNIASPHALSINSSVNVTILGVPGKGQKVLGLVRERIQGWTQTRFSRSRFIHVK